MRFPVKFLWPRAFLAGAVLLMAPAAGLSAQSTAAQTQNPPPQQTAATQQNPAPQDDDSVAGAARKSKTEKSKAAPKKVITDDDLSSIKGDGVSVVGEAGSGKKESNAAPEKAGDAAPAKSGAKDEAYWRGRAKQIRDQIVAVDAEIEKTQEEIKKGGAAGFDPQTGLNQNVIFFEDRNTKLKKLEEKKAELQKQMDDLEDEARKAGVPSGWLR